VKYAVLGPRYTATEPTPLRLSIRSDDALTPSQPKPLTTEDFQAAHRRQLINLIVDVARQLPSDRSIEEARAVVVSASAKDERESFSAAVAMLYDFVGQLQRVLTEQQIDEEPARTLRVVPGKDD